VVSKKQSSLSSLSVRVGQLSQVELAVRRAVRSGGPVLALGALSFLGAAFGAPVLAADAAADSENNKSSNSSQSDDKLQQVVVTARRKAIQSADQLKKDSESIIDTVNADDAGKLPDASITEVLQRVPVSRSLATAVMPITSRPRARAYRCEVCRVWPAESTAVRFSARTAAMV